MWFLSSEYPGCFVAEFEPVSSAEIPSRRFTLVKAAVVLGVTRENLPPPHREIDGYSFVELDVGSERNTNDEQIREVLFSVVASGSIASYRTSRRGFQFRRLGAGEEAAR